MTAKITKEQIEKLKLYRRMKARENLIDFCTLVHPNYEPKPVHYLIADRMEQVFRGEITRLMINTPPRIGKSELASKLAPVWFMGKNPGKSVVLSTYSTTLAEEFGYDARQYVQHEEFSKIFPGSTLSKDSSAKTGWKVEHVDKRGRIFKGMYTNVSIGGSLTGRGGNVLIVDDPVKDRQEANSKTVQENTWNWYTSTFATRGNDRRRDEVTPIIVIQTRWSQQDLSGKLLEAEESALTSKEFKHLAEGWHILKLPVRAEEDEKYYIYNKDYQERLGSEYFIRKKGESIDPDLYPLDKIAKIEYQAPLDFAALYQQTPIVSGGLIFKSEWFKYYKDYDKSKSVMTIHSYDTGSTDRDSSDPTVGHIFEFDGINLYLIEEIRARMLFPDIKKIIQEKAKQYKPDVILIESASSGIDLISELKSTYLPIVPIKTGGESKYIRAISATPFIEKGKLLLPENWSEKNKYIQEFIEFPNSRHDDRVDATGQAIRYTMDIMNQSYFGSALSPKNSFPSFIPPSYWPVYRVINIPSNNEAFSILWLTIANNEDLIYETHRFLKGQLIIFEELVGVRNHGGIDIPEKLPVKEILELAMETEKNYNLEADGTFINGDNKSNDPLQSSIFNEMVDLGVVPFSIKLNHRTSGPYLFDLLSSKEKPLIITQNCKKLWKKLPFILSDPIHSRVFAPNQEMGLIDNLMLCLTSFNEHKEKMKPKEKEKKDIMFDHIFGTEVIDKTEENNGIY